eukprot:253981_1
MVVQTCVSLGLFIMLLTYLHYGYDIMQHALEPTMGDLIYTNIKPDICSTIIWILITFIPHLNIFHKKCRQNIFMLSLIVLFIAGDVDCWFPMQISNAVYDRFSIQYEYIHVVTLSLLFSFCVYKQFSICEHIKIQHSWFDDNYANSYSNNHNSNSLKLIMYSLSNILIFIDIITVHKQCDIIRVHKTIYILGIILMSIPYYLLPSNLKYDLYFKKIQSIMISLIAIISALWMIIYSLYFRYYIYA